MPCQCACAMRISMQEKKKIKYIYNIVNVREIDGKKMFVSINNSHLSVNHD